MTEALTPQQKYERSEKGRAQRRARRKTAAYQATLRKHAQSDKFKAAQKRYKATPKGRQTVKRAKRTFTLRLYGLSPVQYQQMFERQHGLCAICSRPATGRKLDVDHDHQTGRVRGLVCQVCNRFLIGANTIETARRVLLFLESDFDGRKL